MNTEVSLQTRWCSLGHEVVTCESKTLKGVKKKKAQKLHDKDNTHS